jgi:hypothetical protein
MMDRLSVIIITLLSVMALSLSGVFAQTAPALDATKAADPANDDRSLKIGGLMLLWYDSEISRSSSSINNENNSAFSVNRVYLNFRKKFNDNFSMRITPDVENFKQPDSYKQTGSGASTDASQWDLQASKGSRYVFYIKYAYLQWAKIFGDFGITAQFGMIDTPILNLIFTCSDDRWIFSNYVENSSYILVKNMKTSNGILTVSGETIDNSADLGVSVKVDIMKMFSLSGAVVNGAGYKNTLVENSANETYQSSSASSFYKEGTKAYYVMGTYMPLEPLSVSAFYHYRATSSHDESHNFIHYWGTHAAWTDKSYKVGFMFVMPEEKSRTTSGSSNSYNADYIDDATPVKHCNYRVYMGYANVNLNSLIGFPVLMYGRGAYGLSKINGTAGFGGVNAVDRVKTYIFGAGLGYAINENIRFMVYWDVRRIDVLDDPDSEHAWHVKSEVKF